MGRATEGGYGLYGDSWRLGRRLPLPLAHLT